jgi:hypothetical protein
MYCATCGHWHFTVYGHSRRCFGACAHNTESFVWAGKTACRHWKALNNVKETATGEAGPASIGVPAMSGPEHSRTD